MILLAQDMIHSLVLVMNDGRFLESSRIFLFQAVVYLVCKTITAT